MGKKKTGFLPVSTTAELDFRGEPSIPRVQEFQFPSSWAPITPEKPNLPEPRPICADRQENQPSNANWFLPERFSPGFPQETQFHGIGPCSEPSNSIDMNRGENFGNWEADLAWKSPVEDQISSDLSLDSSFRSLLALADAAASTESANATRQGNGGPFITIFKSQFGGSWFESNSTATPPANANQELSFGSNLWNNICAPDTYLYRDSTPSRPTYDLNSPPTALTEAFFGTNVYSQYAPITPDQSKKAENKLAHDIPALSTDQETYQERNNTQGNEVATTRVEVDEQQLPKDLSSAAVSTELDENHNPDKGSNLGIDLNRTPQQKPRRKKHRPKVVIEGKPKMTPKPVTPKPSDHKESLTGKRKYVRRNGLDKNSVTPTAQVTGGNTDPKTAPSTAKSCRRMLNFDSESQVREESSSCRPESNQNGESQAQNFCARVESRSTVQRGQQMEEKVDKTQGGIAYRLTRSVRKMLDDYLSLPELQGPIATTPAKTTLPLEKMKDHDEKGRAKGKCQIVFSDETHDKQASSMQMAMNTDLPSAPRSPNDSNCSSSSSACLTEEERARGLKRGHSCTINEAEPSRTNVIGGHYSSLNEYMTMLPANAYHNYGFQGMLFPTIYKKKRTEKGHCSNTSSTLSTLETNGRFSAAQFNSSCTSTKNTSLIDAQGKQQGLECKLALDQKGRMTKKRSKGPTRVRDFASLIVGCNQYPTFPAQGAPTSSDMQIYETSHHPYACMEALVADSHATKTTKKRTKRNSFASSMTTDGTQKRMPTTETMARYLDGLDINMENIQVTYPEQGQLVPYNFRNEERSAPVPYNLRYVDQNALVLYRRDGTVMPFEGTFNPVRKRRPRPKVDLDEETSRVWKLLLESISSEGIDGTDEEKAKWWEEERRVFRGRADSFIARMHLVQGDRRFSPWKGSVVDSVIGVFLTQNVSDHLSSSAFMSLAARFPLKCEGSDTPCFEETTMWVKEPEVCILDPEESIKWHEEKSNQPARNGSSMPHHDMDFSAEKQFINCNELLEETSKWVKEPEVCILDPEDSIKWHEEKSNQPACNGSSTTLCDMDGSVEKEVINCNELLGSSSGAVRSTENLKCKSKDVYGNDLEIYEKSTGNREVIQLTEAVESLMGEKREMDDVHSPQNSAGSSQNSADSSMAETDERIGSFVQDYSKADPETRSHTNSLVGSSFLELLQRETLCGLHNHKIGDASSCKENGYSYMEGSECDAQNLNKDRSANPNASLRPIISSSNYQLQMNSNAQVHEAESLDILREESLFSDISMKNQENCISEQSGVTAESVNQATVQNVMSMSFQDAPKSPSENNHACSSLQGELNKVFQSRDRPLGNPKDIQFQTQEQNRRMQQVLEVPNLSGDTLDVTDSTSIVNNPKSTEHNAVESSLKDRGYLPGKAIHGMSSETSSVKRGRIGKQKQNQDEWDGLRLQAQAKGKRERTTKTMDSLDYEAVRCADVNEIAYTIRERGMNNMLAERIKDFLNRLVREHGSIDLEWLRDVPPDKAKEYLLSFRGLGLKSVECVRLLTLHHLAFPVDTNVGRIAVRLGWVPLQPLPESLQLHLLELYPVLESIQRYLWPRLCKLDQRTLYELHYQMITFGKVFCTKSKPNCNACPMRGECRHFASAFASARLALPGPEEKSIVSATKKVGANQYPVEGIQPLQLPLLQANEQLQAQSQINNCEPIVEVPATPEPTVEMPATPEPEQQDIEDLFSEDPEEIPTIKLNIEELTQNLQNFMQQNMELQEGEVSKALVALTPEAASLPVPKLKNVSRLRTEHRVYELPDSHPLLEGLDKREPDDPCSYLLAIWTPGETPNSIQPPERSCSSQQFGNLCCEETCFSCSSIREANSQTVRGTLLIPCRTAMRGSFPLNGTYFQVNEVFADHESSINPMDVPRAWLWNLTRRTVYFGTSIPTIFKGLSTESIQYCFWKGFVCVRGFDQKTRAPRPLLARLHFPASKLPKTKSKTDDKQE